MLQHLDKCVDKRGKEYLGNIFQQIATAMATESPEMAIAEFRQILLDLEIQSPTSCTAGELELLAKSVNPIRLKNNPVRLEEKEIRELYNMVLFKSIKC